LSSTDVKRASRADETLSFLRSTYREYYYRNHGTLDIPTKMSNREFGYVPFGGGMVRHISYKTQGELAADLVKQAPSSVYCSNATYSHPTLAMDEKGWIGAELIFDIDAGEIPTSCRSRHLISLCQSCGKSIKGGRPTCPRCEKADLRQLHWSCSECLDATKRHVVRLIEFLTKDFGVSYGDINTYFSGNRGYHLHVVDGRFESLGSPARAEIANYIRGKGLMVRGRPDGGHGEGWSPRIEALVSKGQSQHLLDNAVATYSAMIDSAVTSDVHRIFRMPGTLHGGSGLLKMRVKDIEGFQPTRDPVVLGDESVKVTVDYSPEFYLRGTKFGPYSGKDVDMPCYAAVFLLTKGLGSVSN